MNTWWERGYAWEVRKVGCSWDLTIIICGRGRGEWEEKW
jgi:hypothetical protein